MTARNNFIGIVTLVILAASALPVSAALHDLGTFGHTYPVAERDALKELKEHVSRVDWQKVFNREKFEKAIRDYRPDTEFLPAAGKERTRLVDMTYTLPFDIPDGSGGILYPKGYSFNPLDYIHYDKTIIVINGDDPKQVTWFSHSDYAPKIKTMLLLTGGSYFDLGRKLKRPVFYATTDIIRRFQLEAVPSVIHQEGSYMEVEEIDIADKKSR